VYGQAVWFSAIRKGWKIIDDYRYCWAKENSGLPAVFYHSSAPSLAEPNTQQGIYVTVEKCCPRG